MKKYRIVAAAVVFIVLAGIAVKMFKEDGYEDMSALERPRSKEADREYELQVLYDGRQENITVFIGKRMLAEQELEELFSKAAAELERELLGDNASVDCITENVNLVAELSQYDMGVEWFIDNREIVNYWGEIHRDNSMQEVILTAVLRYRGDTDGEAQSREYSFELCIQPMEDNTALSERFEELVLTAEREYGYEDVIVLPQEFEGKEIRYRRPKSQNYVGLLSLAVLFPALWFVKKRSDEQKRKKKHEQRLIREYPEIIIKLSLLIGAGMTPYNALARIAGDGKGEAYKELAQVIRHIDSGASERAEYADFGRRFGLHCYSRLGTLLEQNAVRGNERLTVMLKEEALEAMEERKARARKAGEQAGTKLLMPMMLMLVVVLAIIMIPSFMSF